jgi:hypothetical protein
MVESLLLETGMEQQAADALVTSIEKLHERGGVLMETAVNAQGKVDMSKVIAHEDLLNVLTAAGVTEQELQTAASSISLKLAEAPDDDATLTSSSASDPTFSARAGKAIAAVGCGLAVAHNEPVAATALCVAAAGLAVASQEECADIVLTVPRIYVGAVANVDALKSSYIEEPMEDVGALFQVTTTMTDCDALTGFEADASQCSVSNDCDAICNPPLADGATTEPPKSFSCDVIVNAGCQCSSDISNQAFNGTKLLAPYNRFCRCIVQDNCGSVDGRPFVVKGAARTAPAVKTSGKASLWMDQLEVAPAAVGTLQNSTRTKIVAHWMEAGAAEHASIASFARHSLQLMAIGAPPGLVVDTHMAGMDEIKHAKMCYGLARAYSGENVAPGKLEISGAITADDQTMDGVLSSVIREGCLGETSAAFEANMAAAGATDPVVKTVLTTIAADEARHAQLGWSFVQWYLSEQGNEGVKVVQALFAHHLDTFSAAFGADAPAAKEAGDQAVLLEHGVLTLSLRLRFRAALVQQLIQPTLAKLVSGSDGAAAELVDVMAKIQTIASEMNEGVQA